MWPRGTFIRGCDSGFGHELAKCLDKLGVTVFAGCLFPESVGVTELKSVCSDKLHVLRLDVTKKEHIQNAVETIKNSLGVTSLWAVVNNAGIVTVGDMEWMTEDAMKKIFDVNTFGPVRVTKAFLPLLRISRGRVVIVSSLAGRHSLPGFGIYSMSKHGAVVLADTLRYELRKWGITVHDIQPAYFRTKILDRVVMQKDLESHWIELSEDVRSLYGQKYLEDFQEETLSFFDGKAEPGSKIYQVVDDLLDAVIGKSPKNVYHPGLSSKLYHFILLLLPQSVLTYCVTSFLPKLQTNKT